MDRQTYIDALNDRWASDSRWQGIERPYGPEAVWRLAGTIPIEHSLASRGAKQFGALLDAEPYIVILYGLVPFDCGSSRSCSYGSSRK